VAISMNPMPLKVIGVKVCLQARCHYGLSKDPGPKGAQTFEVRRSKKKQ